jgi:hypothetical protein
MLLDTLLSPLEVLGPGVVIFILAFLVVGLTRIFSRVYVTRRYLHLEEQFHYWQKIRAEALKHPDKEKGKALAKNIDQAELNRVYYDYFFEGLLKHFITNVLPLLLTVSYVVTVYTPAELLARFGKDSIFIFSLGSDSQVHVSSLLWFVVCALVSFPLIAGIRMMFKKRFSKR